MLLGRILSVSRSSSHFSHFSVYSYVLMGSLSLLFRHPTSCCSVAEIMSVLFFHTMKYRPEDPRNFNNDRFVLSKVRISQPY